MSDFSMSDDKRQTLLQRLDAHHHPSASTANDNETDADLVLRRIVESGRYTTENEIEGAVGEYIGGKPLAYITGA